MNFETPMKYMKEYCKKYNINCCGTKTDVYNNILQFQKQHLHYLILDLETTGLKYDINKIIEIAYIILDENLNEICRNSSLIKVEPNLTDVYDKNLYNEAINCDTTFNEFINDNINIFDCKVLVGHNIQFDKNFLLYNLNNPEDCELSTKLNNMIEYCTMKNFNETKRFSLINAYKFYFNIEFEDVHRAMNDTIACMEVFKKLKTEK